MQPSSLNPSETNLDQIIETGARTLNVCSFEGRVDDMRRTLNNYLTDNDRTDPDGHAMLCKAIDSYGVLSYCSFSTDLDEWRHQSRMRWDAWLDILPLDLQIRLLLKEADIRSVENINLGLIKWHQENDESADRAVNWPARIMAGNLIAWKQWTLVESWMKGAGIQAEEPTHKLYVHYHTRSMRGASLIELTSPIPFWASGLYQEAIEPEFWRAMSRAGGPDGPRLDGRLPSQNFEDAPNWIKERDRPLDPEALETVKQVAKRWSAQELETRLERGTASREQKDRKPKARARL